MSHSEQEDEMAPCPDPEGAPDERPAKRQRGKGRWGGGECAKYCTMAAAQQIKQMQVSPFLPTTFPNFTHRQLRVLNPNNLPDIQLVAQKSHARGCALAAIH
jgi:hypothetical protein